jgi:pyruvate/2-oxoglutarate dehydrogenase complex dihydrolipoamide acyltransferase (E2) component
MDYVDFELSNGKVRKLKRSMAKHLARAGKGHIVEVTASEAVRKEAEAQGINLSDVSGSGKGGRILKRDLQTYQTRMLSAQ